MRTQKLMVVLASAALGLGLAGCAGNADASAPTYKVPTMAQMDKEKQVLSAERDKKIARDYAAKVKAEAEAKAKAEAEAEAQAAAQAQAQAGSGAVANRSGGANRSGTSGRSYQPQARHNYRQGKARSSYNYKTRPRARRGGGGGGNDLGWDPSKGTFIQDSAQNDKKYPNDKRKPGTCTIIGDKTFCD